MELRKKEKTFTGIPSAGMLFSRRDLRALLLPLIAEQLLSYLIGMMDSVMVASAGEAAVSAVSLVDSISVLFINIFSALAAGGAVVVGQYLGRKDLNDSRRSSEQLTVLLAVISAAVTALLLIFQQSVLNLLFGKSEQAVMDNCVIYYHIVMYSVPFIALYNGGAALFRALGDSRTPMRISLLINFINVAGNAVLIYVFKMGVAGVAIPTLVSRGAGMVIIFALALRKSFPLNLRRLHHYRPDLHLIRNILSIGIPNGIENGMFQFGKLILMSLVSSLTIAEVTANAIGNTIGSLHCVVGMAANTSMTAVISQCAGAGDYAQARWYVRYFLRFTYLWQGIVNIALCAAIPFVLQIYGVSGDTAFYATWIMLIHGISSALLWPIAFMLNTAMRAAGDSSFVMVISSLSMWICRVGGAYLLILGFGMSVLGVWIAWVADWIFRIAFFVPRYRGHIWETKALT